MPASFKIVSGDFEGNFYTNQKSVLTASEWNAALKNHEIFLYRGELYSVKQEKEFTPENYRNRASLLLHNVTNVQFHLPQGTKNQNNDLIYDFEQILLRDAVIEHSWEHGGKTYGIIKGKLYGVVRERSSLPDRPSISNPQVPPIPPPPVQPPIKAVPPGQDTESWYSKGQGCLTGFFSNLWRLLLALLLLLLILWFLKGCWNKSEIVQTCCAERDSLQVYYNRCLYEKDSLIEIIVALDDSLKQQEIENEVEKRRIKRGGRVGIITATLIWDTTDDLDISVVEPNGDKIWYKRKKSITGGFLDIDDNREEPYNINPVENIRWLNQAPKGMYSVEVNLFNNRSGEMEIPFFLEITVNDQVLYFEGKLSESNKYEIFDFENIENQ